MKKTTKINALIIVLTMILSLSFCSPIIAYSQSRDEEIQIDIDKENTTVDIEGEEEVNFTNALDLIVYAQEKLQNKTNYSSTAGGVFNVDPNIIGLTIDAGLSSNTIIDEQGNGRTVESCNAYHEFLNGQYGLECYFNKKGTNVYYRQTKKVDTKTGEATFNGDYIQLKDSDAKAKFGYIDNSILVKITKDNFKRQTLFVRSGDYYKVGVEIKTSSGEELRQKLYVCAGLESMPDLSRLSVQFVIDKYGNITNALYKVEGKGLKRIDYDPLNIHAVLNAGLKGSVEQTFSYTAKELVIPDNVVL